MDYGAPSPPTITTTPARTSGTNYDPIRSVSVEAAAVPEPRSLAPRERSPMKRSSNGARASPSIASLIDPPMTMSSRGTAEMAAAATTTATSIPPRTARFVAVSSNGDASQPHSASLPLQSTTEWAKAVQDPPRRPSKAAEEDSAGGAGSVVAPLTTAKTAKKAVVADTDTSTASSSPKPARPKEAPPPASTGSGLLSSALFGGPTSAPAHHATDHRPPTIILNIPIRCPDDRYINFAKLAEERYGFGALHPRLAAQHERLARAAVSGAARERVVGVVGVGSADETSLDVSEPESPGDHAGTEGSADGADKDQKPKQRKRRAKADEYNKEDPFIDDSEMLWQEQAAASKDGFFVYSGPLLKPGERPNIERYVHRFSPHLPSSLSDVSTHYNGCVTDASAGPMVRSSVVVVAVVAGRVEAVEAAEAVGVRRQRRMVQRACPVRAQGPGEAWFANLASPRPTGHGWSGRSMTGRRWRRWRPNPAPTLNRRFYLPNQGYRGCAIDDLIILNLVASECMLYTYAPTTPTLPSGSSFTFLFYCISLSYPKSSTACNSFSKEPEL